MNTTPLPPTTYPTEFRQLIREKSANFVGREFVFSAINNFLSRQNRGYFTIVGAPGSGKSAILAKYVSENPQVIYYSAEVAGKNRAEEFIAIVCSELLRRIGNGNASDESWFLSLLLQKISDLLSPDERLIIAIDGLDRIDANHQPPGTNLFYLPRYLPDKVYFILTRRPFLREKSGLLIEAPFQILDLESYPEENRQDVRNYINRYLSATPPFLREASGDLNSWLITHNINQQEFIEQLIAESDNNFMYLSQILPVIADKLVAGSLGEELRNPVSLKETGFLTPGLAAYYQNHWQQMIGNSLDLIELAVMKVLSQQKEPISAELIAEMIDEDEYDVEEVLENWREFLHQEIIGGENCYSFYHSKFRDWLSKQVN